MPGPSSFTVLVAVAASDLRTAAFHSSTPIQITQLRTTPLLLPPSTSFVPIPSGLRKNGEPQQLPKRSLLRPPAPLQSNSRHCTRQRRALQQDVNVGHWETALTVRMAIRMASQHVRSSEQWMGILREYEAAAASPPSELLSSNI